MSDFLLDFQKFVTENDFHIFRVARICKDLQEDATLIPCPACMDSYSVSKLFVVTAIGLLCDDGKLSVDDKICDLLKDLYPADACAPYSELTIDMVLRHRMGLPRGYLDIDVAHPKTYGNDFLHCILTTSPIEPIGTVRSYTDAAYYLLARVAEAVCGEALESFLWRRLFEPLSFREMAWSKCPQGHVMGATGLFLHTADTAKLGALYLGGGEYCGIKIFSKNWANTVLQRSYELRPICGGKAYAKGGMNGQKLMIFPEAQAVVAWHGYEEKSVQAICDWVCEYHQ